MSSRPVEDLRREVVEQYVGRFRGDDRAAIGPLPQKQHESRHPAVCQPVQVPYFGKGEREAPVLLGQLSGFGHGRPKLCAIDDRERVVHLEAGECRWRSLPADHDDSSVGRQLIKGIAQDVVKEGVVGHLLIVVEHQGERR